MEPVIEVKNVSKNFRKTVALNGVSFDVPPGVVFALLGENGAGKTTLIRSLLGLERQDSGTLKMLGMDPIKDGLAIRRRTGYVSDSPALYKWMTVRQIAHFTASFYPDGFLASFDRLAKDFDLELDQRIRSLSKGGQAKVALALSIAHQPELIILDEPSSGLDAIVRRHFLESMIDIAAQGRTVLLSSHQIAEVERVADWVGVIRDGELVACDELANLKARFERWVVTVDQPDSEIQSDGLQLVAHEGKGKKRQQLMLFDVASGAVDRFRQQENIVDVEVHCASLEEIFVGLMKSKTSASVSHPLVKPVAAAGVGFANALPDNTGTSVSSVDGAGGDSHE